MGTPVDWALPGYFYRQARPSAEWQLYFFSFRIFRRPSMVPLLLHWPVLPPHSLYGSLDLYSMSDILWTSIYMLETVPANKLWLSSYHHCWLKELQALMAHIDLPPEQDKSNEDRKQESPTKPRPKTLQRTRDCLLKAVSYFSGDMQAFGKWMESKSFSLSLINVILTLFTTKEVQQRYIETTITFLDIRTTWWWYLLWPKPQVWLFFKR